MNNSIKVVILCGGRGTRLNEETEFRPKPLVPIGEKPILLHIMNHYAHYGYSNFVICLGYKGDLITKYFIENPQNNWNIEFVDTGVEAQTGTRIKRVEKYIDSDYFLATYGDGISDVNISELVNFHKTKGITATLTAVHPHSKYGQIKEGPGSLIEEFVEKPILNDYINGGFFVFRKEIFDYLSNKEDCILEREPFSKLVSKKQLSMFKHEGFWHCMDTYKDYLELNEMWKEGKRPWVNW